MSTETKHRAATAEPIMVALVGRPNAGKTSLLMHLTGTAQHPVNFPGTSVERVEGTVAVSGGTLRIVDLPGLSSLAALTRDEEVSLAFLRGERGIPDVLCAVLDASKLSVELALFAELVQLQRPIVVALNKTDVARADHRGVDTAALAQELGVSVVETDGLRARGMDALGAALVTAAGKPPPRPLRAHPDLIAARLQARSVQPPPHSFTDRIDDVVLHRWLGLPLLGVVMFGMFQLVFSGAEPVIGLIENGQAWLGKSIAATVPSGALRSLLVDGVVNGVGAVLVFLPQIALLIGMVAVLEATGYMARAAFLLDRLLRRVGLSGRSFVPLTTSFACAIPGILASRIISDERDRLATIVVSPLMSCSARLPVYVVLIGAFFPSRWAGTVLFGLYGLGIATAAIVAFVLRRTVLRGGRSLLMMELPVFQRPSLRVVWSQVRSACREFLALAGTIILGTAVVIWALGYYPRPAAIAAHYDLQRTAVAQLPDDERDAQLLRLDAAERAAYLEQSYLASAGRFVQPLFAPAGFDWRTTVGILAAFPARELIVPTLGILHSLGELDPGQFDLAELEHAGQTPGGLRQQLRAARRPDGTRAFDAAIALALMVFFALCSQCVATLGAIRRETHSWRWPLFTFTYMTTLAWAAAVVVYQVSHFCGLGANP